MSVPIFNFRSPIRIALISGITLAGSLSGFCQSGNGRVPPGNTEAQQTQQQDNREQELQRERQDEALRHPFDDLEHLQLRIWDMDSERLRLKELLRANFLQHYAVIRRNTDELVQLAASLQTSLDSNAAPPPAHDLKAKTVRMQKLAHEIRENMAGWKVPKARRMRARAPAMPGANNLDGRQLLRANVSAAQAAASQLQTAVEDYLGSDNEQSVSVRALQTSADKQHFDPQLVAILKNSVQLEQLAREIRSKIHTLYPSH